MTNEIKLGVIGCGKQASKHIAGLQKIPGIEIVLADIKRELAEKMAADTGTSSVEKTDQIFADEKIQGLVICTPTQSHAPLIKKALDTGKHVFCEKPLSDNADEIKGLIDMAGNKDLVVMIGYIYRFVPAFEEGFRLFHEARIDGHSMVFGKPLHAFLRIGGRGSHEAWKHRKETGGGAINEMLVHMIDLANWYFGPLENIKVLSSKLYLPERVIKGEKVIADAEDFILMYCTGIQGMDIYLQADLITPAFTQYMEVQGENGTFRGSIQQESPSFVFLKQGRGGYQAGRTELSFGSRNLLDHQMLAFVLAMLQKKKPEINTIEDSLQLIQIMDTIKEQIKE